MKEEYNWVFGWLMEGKYLSYSNHHSEKYFEMQMVSSEGYPKLNIHQEVTLPVLVCCRKRPELKLWDEFTLTDLVIELWYKGKI